MFTYCHLSAHELNNVFKYLLILPLDIVSQESVIIRG